MKLAVFNKKGKEVENIEVSDSVFAGKVNDKVLTQYIYAYLSNQRETNAETKDKSEVSGGGKKPFRQKGTGRARAGSIRSPLWRGGGVTFGATNDRNYKKKLTKKFKAAAFRSAFSYLAKNDLLRVVDGLNIEGETKLTKEALDIISNFGNPKKLMIVTSSKNESLLKGFSNVSNAKVQMVSKINVYDLMNAGVVLIEKDALEYTNKWAKTSKE